MLHFKNKREKKIDKNMQMHPYEIEKIDYMI